MIVFCTGMVRSASTWSYNACLWLLRLSHPDATIFCDYQESIGSIADEIERHQHSVVKCHSMDEVGKRMLLSGKAKAIYTVRHPYESISSGMMVFGSSFESMLDAVFLSLTFFDFQAVTGQLLVVKFEDFSADPHGTIVDLAEFMGLSLSEAELTEVEQRCDRTTLSVIARDIEKFPESELYRDETYLYHRATKIHRGHFRESNAIILSSEQMEAVESRLAPWAPHFGWDWDL